MKSYKLSGFAAVLLAGTAFASLPAMSQENTQPQQPIPPQQSVQGETATTPSEGSTGAAATQDQSTGETSAGAAAGETTTPSEGSTGAAATQEPNAGETNTGESGSVAGEAPAQPENEGQAATTSPSGETTAAINITDEQKTEIRNVIVESDAEPVDVDIDVSVGVSVPDSVELHPLPARIVQIVPEYEGYMYFVLADGRIVIVDPDSHDIVYIIVA